MNEKTILVVDDDRSVTSIFEFILNQVGYAAVTAASHDACLDTLRTHQPVDLIFLDIAMTEYPVDELIKKILTLRPQLKVVVMSNYSGSRLARLAFDSGAYGIIYKPFDIEEILSVIDKIFHIAAQFNRSSEKE